MNNIKFAKLHGNGNDYIFIENFNNKIEDLSNLSIKLSNRNFSIGSDGLIVADKSDIADVKMLMYNADGSRGAMCGNGIRCLAKYVYDMDIVNKTDLKIETDSGIKHVKIDKIDKNIAVVTVNMGKPSDISKKILNIDNEQISINTISMGNPHSISFINELNKAIQKKFMLSNINHANLSAFNDTNYLDELNYFDIENFGKKINSDSFFENGVNVEIAKIIDDENIAMRVFERGSGETLSCGTGCCATAVVAIMKNKVKKDVFVHTLGGKLKISFSGDECDDVFMTGNAITVFKGELL